MEYLQIFTLHLIGHQVTKTLDAASELLDQVEMVVEEAANLPPGPVFIISRCSSTRPVLVELLNSEHQSTSYIYQMTPAALKSDDKKRRSLA